MSEPSQPDGRLLKEFKEVHAVIRTDIGRCRDLASAVAGGAAPEAIRKEVGRLQSTSLIFQLRVNCLQACGFVHLHHRGEDSLLFPSVRKAAPHLSPVVDRLENDHRLVSDLLDEVEAATESATSGGNEISVLAGRQRLVDALETLTNHLFEHLDFEETKLAPVINSWKRWPFYA
jgi:hypothetical protein